MGISTHILDTALGKPAAGVAVNLERRLANGTWQPIATQDTDSDGRCRDLVPAGTPLATGIYRLRFDTDRYFRRQQIEGLFPEVCVAFNVRQTAAHYHIPLLLSPNSYTTYRGS